MPSNQHRREAAKRKLQRQLERRQERDKARRQRLIIVGAVVAVLVLAGGVWYFTSRGDSPDTASDGDGTSASTESSAPAEPCTYTASGTAAKDVTAPTNTSPANTGTVDVEIVVNGEKVPATLDRAAAPCTVNSFVSLASQGFYDDTDCHRLTKSEDLNILQCGDPTGKGNGGPGYTFANENTSVTEYPVGSLVMANAGTDTNGSQFFIVYGNSVPQGSYTLFGTVTDAGMKVVDAIATKGVVDGQLSGKPVAAATIDSITVPADAVTATGDWPTTSAEATDALPTDALPSESEAVPTESESTLTESESTLTEEPPTTAESSLPPTQTTTN